MSNIPQDFLDLDSDADHWIETGYDGRHWIVPATETGDGKILSDMTDAMMSEIPGQDDVVTPRKLSEQRFYKFCMAYLMQDGNLGVPGGHYGRDTMDCAPVAILVSVIMRYHSGEPVTYYQLHNDMGLVVNSHDDVARLLVEYGELALDDENFSPYDYLDDETVEEVREQIRAEMGN